MDTVWVVTRRNYTETNIFALFDGSIDEQIVKSQIEKTFPRIDWKYPDYMLGVVSNHVEIEIYMMNVDKVNNG